jgi:hypothetical protein
MERGLLWLPLLAVFIGLAWAGWNEYQKVEAYRQWASSFERAKYDLYAVVGQAERQLTWGKPSRKGPIDLQTLCLDDLQAVQLQIDNQLFGPEILSEILGPEVGEQSSPQATLESLEQSLARNSKISLELSLADRKVQIPFTELSLAVEWWRWLLGDLQK